MDNMSEQIGKTLRIARNDKLEKSDVALLRALEEGDTDAVSALRTYRQALRDLPDLIDDPWTEESVVPTMPLSPEEQAILDAASE